MSAQPPTGQATSRSPAQSDWHDTLIALAQQTLRATSALAHVLGDRLAYACATDSGELDNIPPEHLVDIIAVSDALQDGACRTLWLIHPELARNGRIIASLARDGAGGR